jgi:hypothetical protein
MIWSGVTAVVAALALLTSVAIYRLTREAEDKRERRARMPVLVVVIDDDQIVVRNVGRGPALNVFLAQGEVGASDERIQLGAVGDRETWFNPVHLRPIAAGATSDPIVLRKQQLRLKRAPGSERLHADVGVTYTDAMGFHYTVKMNDTGTYLREGCHLPEWPDAPYPGQLPNEPRWLEVRPSVSRSRPGANRWTRAYDHHK